MKNLQGKQGSKCTNPEGSSGTVSDPEFTVSGKI